MITHFFASEIDGSHHTGPLPYERYVASDYTSAVPDSDFTSNTAAVPNILNSWQ